MAENFYQMTGFQGSRVKIIGKEATVCMRPAWDELVSKDSFKPNLVSFYINVVSRIFLNFLSINFVSFYINEVSRDVHGATLYWPSKDDNV